MSDSTTHHQLGGHEARLDALEAQSLRIESKLDEVLAYMNQNKGGIKVLSAVAAAAASVGAGVVGLIQFFTGKHP